MTTVAWDNQDVGQRTNDRLSFKKDKIDRICLLDQDATFALIHYVEPGGYVHCTGFEFVQVVDPQTQQQKLELRKVRQCRFCEIDSKPEPQQRFASKAIIYGTDQDGVPLNPLTFKIKWWSFNQNHFRTLRSYRRQKNTDIRLHDIQVTCTNEGYQHLELQIMEEAWWVMNEQFKQMVAEAYRNCRFDLEHLLGQRVPLEKQDEYIKRKQQGGRGGSRNDNQRKESQVAPPNVFAGGGPINPFGTPAALPPPPTPALSAANPFAPPPATAPVPALTLPPPPPLLSATAAVPPAISATPGTPVFGAPPVPPAPALSASQALASPAVPQNQPGPVPVTIFPPNPGALAPAPTNPTAVLGSSPKKEEEAKSLDDMLAAIEGGA